MLIAKELEGLFKLSWFCELRPHLRSMEQGMEKGRIWTEGTGWRWLHGSRTELVEES